MLLLIFFIGLFGLAIGSFLNVVVYRLNFDENPLKGRSFCPQCRHQLAWSDNLPLLSFVFLGGKCRYCHSPISFQYPLVELATALFSILIWQWSVAQGDSLLITMIYLLVTYALLALFASDLLYQTLPDQISYSAGVLLISLMILTRQWSFFWAGLGAMGFFLFLHLITKGRGMAMGDVKLVFLLGLFLGWPKVGICLFLAFLTGAGVGVILILLRRVRFGQPIPFGPFLIGGAWAALFWGETILNYYLALLGF